MIPYHQSEALNEYLPGDQDMQYPDHIEMDIALTLSGVGKWISTQESSKLSVLPGIVLSFQQDIARIKDASKWEESIDEKIENNYR